MVLVHNYECMAEHFSIGLISLQTLIKDELGRVSVKIYLVVFNFGCPQIKLLRLRKGRRQKYLVTAPTLLVMN